MSRRIPELYTERLLIRELTMGDLETINTVLNRAFGTQVSSQERQRWLQWTVLGYEMFAMLEQPHYGERAIVLKESGEIIGAVGIVPYVDTVNDVAALKRAADAPATAEVGLFWAIDPAYQGRGYAPEAARAVAEYLFTHQNLGRVIATTDFENSASQKVMEKIGMTVQRLEKPRPPDQFVVGVLDQDGYKPGVTK